MLLSLLGHGGTQGTWLGVQQGTAMVSGSHSGVYSKSCYSAVGCSGADTALA